MSYRVPISLDELLADLIANDSYIELELHVDKLIQRYGYSRTQKRLLQIIEKRNAWKWSLHSRDHKEFIPVGKVRDMFLRLFGLGCVYGIESGNCITALGNRIKANSLQDLRNKIIPRAKKKLENQIKRGNTFFLDIEDMILTPFAYLIDDILCTRREQLEGLPSSVSLSTAVGTYYGFKILTRNQVDFRVPDKKPFEELCAEFDNDLGVKGKRFSYTETMWDYCSHEVRSILLNLLRVYTTVNHTSETAYKWLMARRDARIKGELMSFRKSIPDHEGQCFKVSGQYFQEFDALVQIQEKHYEAALSKMAEMSYDCHTVNSSAYFWMKCEKENVFDFLEDKLVSEECNIRNAATRALMNLGHFGISLLRKHRKLVLETIDDSMWEMSPTTLYGKRYSDSVKEVLA